MNASSSENGFPAPPPPVAAWLRGLFWIFVGAAALTPVGEAS